MTTTFLLILDTISPLFVVAEIGFAFAVAAIGRWDSRERRAAVLALASKNCANYGLPIILFAFGDEGVVIATVFVITHILVHMTVGLSIASWSGEHAAVIDGRQHPHDLGDPRVPRLAPHGQMTSSGNVPLRSTRSAHRPTMGRTDDVFCHVRVDGEKREMHDRGAIHRKLLLAEDCPTDIQVFKRALRRSNCGARYELQVLIDGAETLDFLFKRGRWSDAWTPDVLVLNINMPKCNGWDVLRRMKSDPGLRGIPTVIWTIASIEEYDARTYDWGA